MVDFLPKVVQQIIPEVDPAAFSTPLLEQMKPPVYGDADPSFRDYIAPALILGIFS